MRATLTTMRMAGKGGPLFSGLVYEIPLKTLVASVIDRTNTSAPNPARDIATFFSGRVSRLE